jgi:hypothetical protein
MRHTAKEGDSAFDKIRICIEFYTKIKVGYNRLDLCKKRGPVISPLKRNAGP